MFVQIVQFSLLISEHDLTDLLVGVPLDVCEFVFAHRQLAAASVVISRDDHLIVIDAEERLAVFVVAPPAQLLCRGV